jgi:hypothetical protein
MMTSAEIAQLFAAQNQMFLIYGLLDPRTGELRYIGKSCSGLRRPRQHIQPDRLKAHTHKNNWVRSLLKIGLRPKIAVLATSESKEGLSERERELIQKHKEAGSRLTNLTDGGEGTSGHRKSTETKARISESVRRSREDLNVRIRIALGKGCKPFREVRSGKIYRTVVEAATELNLHRSCISNVLAGRYHSTEGFVFEYVAPE